ncbi:FGGY family carbohydrate kinase [Dasania sp. GY-MA-18]|uniref:FGGY family carbohydrate kinase n=1 Tax=Dasania phycosphaerae TaxID=2950436 RepID=A0A9J6RKD6_9GAMM|nr:MULTISPECIES: FGGY family carbohydrate kinase [Dasania]MCR8922440.1 FGGY family carbohydrate kinase [Dasania sp. GY-MA-18]MCZ0864868.1 FGGY family carbohydrate kinase [Dasania phycosphaerae]MCZ0868596.1 FGGY family carbohydrate kinase [Dasania phycosphaerae]
MNDALYLCLDQGGSSSRAMVFDSLGQCLAQSQLAVAEHRQGERVEQDAAQLVASLRSCANAAVAQLTWPQRAALSACGLVTQRSSLVAFNPVTEELLSPVLSWQDTRAAEHLPSSADDIQLIYQHTGLMANAHFSASKMCWLLQHNDAVKKAAQQQQLILAPLACYLAHSLLANKPILVDRGNASRTLLVDVAKGQWCPQMLGLWGLDRCYLPSLVASDAIIGQLELDDISLPMRLLTGDQCAAAFAQGELQAQQVSINMGTGAFLLSPVATPQCRNGLLNSIVHWAELPVYCLEGTVNGAGVALQYIAKQGELKDDALPLDACLHLADKQADALAQTLPLFINTVSGLGSPDWRSGIAPRFIGHELANHSLRVAAVAESIVFLLQRNLECMLREKPALQYVAVSGGLSHSDALCQRLSDLSGLRVERSSVVEASARGAAYLLAGRPAHWPCIIERVFQPQDNHPLRQRYRQWSTALMQQLQH